MNSHGSSVAGSGTISSSGCCIRIAASTIGTGVKTGNGEVQRLALVAAGSGTVTWSCSNSVPVTTTDEAKCPSGDTGTGEDILFRLRCCHMYTRGIAAITDSSSTTLTATSTGIDTTTIVKAKLDVRGSDISVITGLFYSELLLYKYIYLLYSVQQLLHALSQFNGEYFIHVRQLKRTPITIIKLRI